VLTRPDVIKAIHKQYLDAGSDIIETNTFNATSVSQADYGMEAEVYRINKAAAQLACEAAREYSTEAKPRFVAGSMGPTNKTASMSSDVNNPGYRAITFDQLAEAYGEQVRGLLDGGVDILLVETVFDTLNAKAALYAVNRELARRSIEKFPVMISATVADKSGRILSGQTVEALLYSVEHIDLLSVGLNCSFGAHEMMPYLDDLGKKSPFLNRLGKGFLQPNRLAITDGCRCDKRMPEIGKTYHHRIDIRLSADLFVVLVNAHFRTIAIRRFDMIGGKSRPLHVKIANSDNTRNIRSCKNARHLKLCRDASATDYRHIDLRIPAECAAASEQQRRSESCETGL
jgi:S-methylmethionine-dependent homocysteine/selenocysteine methylase